MCGGAIISDFISTYRSKRLTADYLWSGLKNNSCNYYSKPLRSEITDVNDDFEADFQEFKDESDGEKKDVKPFSFTPKSLPPGDVYCIIRVTGLSAGTEDIGDSVGAVIYYAFVSDESETDDVECGQLSPTFHVCISGQRGGAHK
ncbi:hypothetical protein NE237_007793 [Protea cynaroides]|uniref:Uncharacterized protein n=1 Tax=Protea cynaroides TaxID=273540 RepID=A0A9Q0KQV0_9MAGN|nr:hypothetical protein NE237_007793 [Protea cynaroides]